MLSCFGHHLAQTPNIDGLAAKGTRFIAHYTNRTNLACRPVPVLQEDFYSSSDQFLLAAGTKITEVQVAQLHNIHLATGLNTNFKIHRIRKPQPGEHRKS